MFDRRNPEFIINSLLDVDFYKFTMGQVVFKRYVDVVVTFALKCRTKGVRLLDHIDLDELRRQLDHVMQLSFGSSDLHYLRGTNEYGERMFGEPYLEFLGQLRLPPYDLKVVNSDLALEFTGKWSEVIYWETIALGIVNELYFQSLMRGLSQFGRECVYATGQLRLMEKINRLKARPDVIYTDFGTRRRFGFSWQDYVVGTSARELPRAQFLGTSNTYLANKHNILPMGTSAHERDMVLAGIFGETDEGVASAVKRSLKEWWEEYGWGLSVALTDTFGSDFFFRSMTAQQAREWKGLRQDSGDPIVFGEKAIAFYEGYGIDSRTKLIIFSDGLDLDTIFKIADHFKDRIKCSFGWGTNLTNDLGFPALSLVVKTVKANGRNLVKLSDNLAKAIGDPREIERYKRICGYTNTGRTECRY